MDTLFFIISKLVGLCLQVETWLAVALALAVLAGFLGRKRVSAALSAAAFLAVTLISIFPIGEVLLAPLEAEYATRNIPDQIDGIVVLGGAESPRKTMRWNQPQLNDASERLIAAAGLAIAHPEARIVYAGGSGRLLDNVSGRAPLPPIATEVFRSLGIDPERIIWEDQSRNTAENAQRSFDLVQPAPGETWILITSAFHMGRAMASFDAAGWRNVVPYGRDLKTKYRDSANLFLLDPIYDPDALYAVRTRASVYLHGHSAGGTNPSLVEMMHFGVPVLAHGCSFNRHTTEGKARYFESAAELAEQLRNLDTEDADRIGADMLEIAQSKYTWDQIGTAYFELLNRA